MSNRIYGTEKVDNIIGLHDRNVYDSIDIFVDKADYNNLWGMVYYTEYKNHKPIKKQEIVHFLNHQAMIDYVKENFNGYELDHPVDIEHKQLFFHYVNYCDLKYYVHEGKPDKNFIEIRYLEYENGVFNSKRIKLPKEYEQMFIMILKNSKKIPDNMVLSPRYYSDVDAYEERSNNRKEIIRCITLPLGEFFSLAGEKIKKIATNKKTYKRLKILVSTAALGTLLAGGYKLVTDNIYNSDYLIQKNPIRSFQDVGIYVNKGKVGKTIDKLLNNQYDEVSPDELKYAVEFIEDIDDSNYDGNASFNSFSYTDYFKYELSEDVSFASSSVVLKKIEDLYNACFYVNNGKVTIRQENVSKYIDYVASLSFMYDTYHTDRPVSYVQIETQGITSKYARSEEIAVFDSFPPVLRYIILNQLQGLMKRCDYKVTVKPSYYFKGTDKYELLTELKNKIDQTLDQMYFQCGYNYSSRNR